MAYLRITAVTRAGAFSPNHVSTDATILNAVAQQLRRRGCQVDVCSEEELCARGDLGEDVIINMCRQWGSLRLLQQLEDKGTLVVNSGYGIANCICQRQATILANCGAPFPPSIVADTDEVVTERLREAGIGRCWVRRGDAHATHGEDVCYARTPEQAQDVLREFFLRGFRTAVISRYVPGRPVKFYAVEGTDFLDWLMPYEEEDLTSASEEGAAIEVQVRAVAGQVAKALDLRVFGGDCVVDPQGRLWLTDVNDWPSFAPCLRGAATAIAKRVFALGRERARQRE